MGVLRVDVISATNLLAADRGGESPRFLCSLVVF